ncbi:hypothetical protein C8Q80DRAFT_1137586 [Daedaleopsis nitida]|nr:hypothetical protein C8Q80DRAFT_1137586 [Daedaleopsis nitida]
MSSAATSTTATPSTTPSGTAGADPNVEGGGGSTIILALVALAVFCGGAVFAFLLRRYVVSNRRRIIAYEAARGRVWNWDDGRAPSLYTSMTVLRRSNDSMKRPELWDVRATIPRDAEWENIQPIAVKVVRGDADTSSPRCEDEPSSYPAASSQTPSSESSFFYPFRVGLRDFAAQVSALRPPQYPDPRLPPPHPPRHTQPATFSDDSETASYAQVALAIMMPTDNAMPCQSSVPPYALALTTVPWQRKNATYDENKHVETSV